MKKIALLLTLFLLPTLQADAACSSPARSDIASFIAFHTCSDGATVSAEKAANLRSLLKEILPECQTYWRNNSLPAPLILAKKQTHWLDRDRKSRLFPARIVAYAIMQHAEKIGDAREWLKTFSSSSDGILETSHDPSYWNIWTIIHHHKVFVDSTGPEEQVHMAIDVLREKPSTGRWTEIIWPSDSAAKPTQPYFYRVNYYRLLGIVFRSYMQQLRSTGTSNPEPTLDALAVKHGVIPPPAE